MDYTSVEFWGLVFTVLAGFGATGLLLLRLVFQLGEKTNEIRIIARTGETTAASLAHHEEECGRLSKEIHERLARGSKEMAVLKEQRKADREILEEIRRAVVK